MTPARKQRFPRWWQALIIIGSGIVLSFSSCIGFLGTMSFSGANRGVQIVPLLLMVGFFGGIVLAFIGGVLLLIAAARALVDSFRAPAVEPASMLGADAASGLPVPGVAPAPPSPGLFGITASREEPALRQFQIALVVLMLLPLGGVATTFLIFLNRPRAWGSFLLILSSYVLSQAPYAFALARTRRGLDRLGIAIAFAASCCFFVEGLLPVFELRHMPVAWAGPILFSWPGLFLIGHVVVAVFAFRAGRLAPPEGDDLSLIATSFVAVIAYLVFIRFLEVHFLPFLLR